MSRKIAVPVPSGVRSLVDISTQRGSANEGEWIIPCRLITPLFGGGHTAGENDPVTPISAKAIRGQLRYWWRAIAGPRLKNPTGLGATELLALREAEVFGSPELPSPFDLMVSAGLVRFRELGSDDRQPYGFRSFGPVMYALFPTDRDHKVARLIQEGLTFQLELRWPDKIAFSRRAGLEAERRRALIQKNGEGAAKAQSRQPVLPPPWDLAQVQAQLSAALWGWLNFGGIGSRTRRGVGAVATNDARFSLLGDNRHLRYALPNSAFYVGPAVSNRDREIQCWAHAVEVYQEFRQKNVRSKHPGRRKQILRSRFSRATRTQEVYVNPQPARVENGRTGWPEPDAIRDMTGSHLVGKTVILPDGTSFTQNDHSIPTNSDVTGRAFPRAILGLPINFHFADGPVKGSNSVGITDQERDPGDVQLVPQVVDQRGVKVTGQRMGSPVITRPLCVSGQWHPAVIVIRREELNGLAAQITGATVAPSAGAVPANQIMGPKLRALAVLQGKDNALSALERYLLENRRFTRLDDGGRK